MFNNIKKITQIVILIILMSLVLTASFFWFSNRQPSNNSKNDTFNISLDKTIIVQQIKQVQVLNTVEQTLQRDFEVEIKSQDLEIFNRLILPSSRSQKFSITGKVSAGIDLSLIADKDIVFDTENNLIKIKIPEPKITGVSLLEDRLYLIQDRSSFLFNMQNLSSETSRSRNQNLQQEIFRAGNQAMVEAACQNKILENANQNAKESIKNLFLLFNQEIKIEIETSEQGECLYPSQN